MSKRVIISGGGTGGHIFPAIAIGQALQRANPDIALLYVGAKGRMEMVKVPEAGYKIKGLWISGFQRSLSIANLLFPLKLVVALIQSFFVIKSFKPDVVIGVGGYASGPLLKVANWLGIPSVIQEQNSLPGVTNRILATKAKKICVVFEGMDKYFPSDKIVLTGNPVRASIMNPLPPKKEALAYFSIHNDRPALLVTGGSLGAKAINQCIKNNLDFFAQNDINLIWQTGAVYYEECRAIGELPNGSIKIMPFIKEMDMAYAAADIIISRAGGTIAELAIVGKPAILLPSPNVAEDHQAHNAMALVNKNAAIMIRDSEAEQKLFPTLSNLLADREKQKELGENIKKMAIVNAADRIANVVLNVVNEASV